MKVFPIHSFKGKEYSLPYYLPERKSHKCSITIDFKKPGTTLPVVSMRNSLFMGLPMVSLKVDRPLGIHTLKQEGMGTWMTSMPQEIEQHSRQLTGMSGRVLVGGLGLGLAVAYLEGNEDVTEIVCVEKSQSIIHMVLPFMPKKKTKVINMDLFKYLESQRAITICNPPAKETFDHAFYDIWCPTGETVHSKYVIPLRKLSQGLIPQENIQCWNEDEMIGQLALACQTSLMYLDMPVGDKFRTILDEPEDRFDRYKKVQGLVWYWYRFLRREKLTIAQAHAQMGRYLADLKDPERFERNWM